MCVCVRANAEEVLPVRPQKDWVHMDKVEPEKLEWMRDLPAPRKKGTKKVENKKNKVLIILSGFREVRRLAKSNCGVLVGNASSV